MDASRAHLRRQINHWVLAAERLGELDDHASPQAWAGLEAYLGVRLRAHLEGLSRNLVRPADSLRRGVADSRTEADIRRMHRRLVAFRARYLRAETTLDFFVDAINTRTNDETASLLGACDQMARQSMAGPLARLGHETPPVLTYLDRGLGASILKAGLRLWDGGDVSPVAAIKIVRHNLFRTTALIHEAGHQFAHITNWVGELRAVLADVVGARSRYLGQVWTNWASEVAADAFAFTHTGYASAVGLHDVLAGSPSFVFRLTPGDPHPTSFIRVLLGVEMCRHYYGDGPWDGLAADWKARYPLQAAESDLADIVERSEPLLGAIVEGVLRRPMRAFGGHPLDKLVDPCMASPESLERLEQELGPALYTSSRWLRSKAVSLLALSGLRMAAEPGKVRSLVQSQKEWMMRLGRMDRALAA